MDLNQILEVRKQILEGKKVPIETLQACIAHLRDNRISAVAKKPKATKEPKKSGEDIMKELMNL